MFIKIILFLGVFALSSAMFDGEPREVKCKGEVIKNNQNFHKNIKICVGEFKEAIEKKTEGQKRGFRCLIMCALAKDGLFDDKGMYNEAKMNENIDGSLPAPLAAILKEESSACVKNNPSPGYDPADTTCLKYKPLLKCFRKGWMKTCVEGYDPSVMEEEDS